MPLDLFAKDQQNALADAAHSIAPDLTAGFGEGFDVALRTGTEWHNSIATQYAKEHALDDYIADIKQRTGETLPNPGYLIGPSLDDFNKRIAAVNETYPVNLPPLTDDDIDTMTRKRMAAAHAQEEKWDGRDRSWGSVFGRGLGVLAASLTDPALLVTLPFGGTGELGVAGRALEFGAIGAGSEALVAAGSGAARERAVPGSAAQIPLEIATAGGFGLALGGAFGALGKWLGHGRQTLPTSVRDEVNAAASESQFDAANVFDGPAAEIANRDAVTQAATSIVKGEPVTAAQEFTAPPVASDVAEEKLRPISWREAPEVERFDPLPDRYDDMVPDDAGGRVYRDIEAQLRAAGVPEDQIAANAAVFAARYETRAARLGGDADAEALYRAENFSVVAGDDGAAWTFLQAGTAGIKRPLTAQQHAEEIWQLTEGKMRRAMEQVTTIRRFLERDPEMVALRTPGMDSAKIDAIEAHLKELAKQPFVSQKKLDRIAEYAADIKDSNGVVGLEDLRAKFPNETDDVLNRALSFKQRGADGAKGAIDLADNAAVVRLFEKSDASTLMHEAGHKWLDEMVGDVARADAPQQIKDDLGKLLDWFGVDEAAKIGTKQHEQFARGFEEYLREGRAPSPALQSVFDQFKDWLTRIYKRLTDLGGDHVAISDEVRGVMDRMLATDSEIAVQRGPLRQPVPGDLAGLPALPSGVRVAGVGPHGPVLDGFAGRWDDAVQWMRAAQTGDARGVLAHPAIDGPIDVIWGDKNGGLAHILDKHPDAVPDLPQRLAAMQVVSASDNRVRLSDGAVEAVVSRDFKGEAKDWLLTAYRKGDPGGGPGLRPAADLRSELSPYYGAEGAGSRSNLGPIARDLNPEQLAKLADEPATADAVQHDLEHILAGKPDMTIDFQTRNADGSYSLQSRKLSDVLAEIAESERAGKELEACVVGLEAAE